jgi:CubicO group peptidase (beta-lactamase class C family)
MANRVPCLLFVALSLLGCARQGEPDFPDQFVPGMVAEGPDWAARRQRLSYAIPEVERYLLGEVDRERIPSLVAAVVVDGRAIYWRGFGVRDLRLGGPVTSQTIYRIGSITKLITGMAVLKLRDDGMLHLDTPAEVYVPELREVKYPPVGGPRITVRHLLTHTAGLPRVGGLEYTKRSTPMTERELLSVVREVKMQRPAGVRAYYSNLGYAVLGVIVGRAAGMRYRDYVTQNILEPIGMTLARWDTGAVPHDQLATGYTFEQNNHKAKPHWLMGAAEGMGGLYASLDDMVRFLSYHMSAWPPGSRPDYDPLTSATLRESHLGFRGPLPTTRSATWALSKRAGVGLMVSHNGATANYSAMLTFAPERRIGFIAMSNSGHASDALSRFGERVMQIMLSRERGAGARPRFRRAPGR